MYVCDSRLGSSPSTRSDDDSFTSCGHGEHKTLVGHRGFREGCNVGGAYVVGEVIGSHFLGAAWRDTVRFRGDGCRSVFC